MALDIGVLNAEVKARGSQDPLFARMSLMFEQIENSVNQIGSLSGVDASGHVSAPTAPSQISVKAANGIAHVTLNDGAQRDRTLNYFVEADTDPSFSNPHVEHLGASRGKFFALPGLNDDGDTQNWHFRGYSMQLGSESASEHVYFGTPSAPTPVDVGGTTHLTPLVSTGAGTASTNGQQGGEGFGTYQLAKPA
jgi:hypothetical protein